MPTSPHREMATQTNAPLPDGLEVDGYRIVRKIGVNNTRFFVNGTNLFSWDYLKDSDPETASGPTEPIKSAVCKARPFKVAARIKFPLIIL